MEPTGSPAAPRPGTEPVPPAGDPAAARPGGTVTPPATGTTGATGGAPTSPGGAARPLGGTVAPMSVPPAAAPGASASGATSITDPAPAASRGLTGGDWPAQATNTIVDLVGTVRDKTTGPITTAARGLVFGFFAAVLAGIIGVLAIIAVIRLLDEALPSGVWLPYLILGVLFVVAGTLVFRKRKAPVAT